MSTAAKRRNVKARHGSAGNRTEDERVPQGMTPAPNEAPMPEATLKVPVKEKIGYAMGDIATNFFFQSMILY